MGFPSGAVRTPKNSGTKAISLKTQSSATNFIMRMIKRYPVMDPADEIETSRRAAQGNKHAQDLLLLHNLGLVAKICYEYRGHGVPFEDLFSEGAIGLQLAIPRFDPKKGNKLSTYVLYWIHKGIVTAVRRNSLVRSSYYQQKCFREASDAARELEIILGRKATHQEIAQHLHRKEKHVKFALEETPSLYCDVPLDAPAVPGLPFTIGETLFVDAADLGLLDQKSTYDRLRECLEGLTDIERTVIRSRFGLSGEPPLTYKETAQRIGISRERIRQIERQALGKLKYAFQYLEKQDRERKRRMKGSSLPKPSKRELTLEEVFKKAKIKVACIAIENVHSAKRKRSA